MIENGTMASITHSPAFDPPATAWRRRALLGAGVVGFTLYISVAVFGTLIFPPAFVAFMAPIALIIASQAPALRAAPKKILMPIIYLAALLLPLWPIYISVKLGPLPAMTPPRVLLYIVTLFWIYDMVVSPMRRGQLAAAFRHGGLVAIPVMILWTLNLLSVPMAEGRVLAGQEFLRQTIIWTLPFLAMLTYVRRQRELKTILVILTLAAVAVALIGVYEFATRQLIANSLTPFIAESEWRRAIQTLKIRDGVFRAQATHTHPLSLGELLALASPLALAFLLGARRRWKRLLWALALFVIVVGAYTTNSRGAMLAIAFGLSASGLIFAARFLKRPSAWPLQPVAALAAAAALSLAPALFVKAHGIAIGVEGQSAANSSQSRIDQMTMAWPKILKRPALGYGTGRSTRVLGYWGMMLTIDNYYLSLALDLGFPGPVTFAILCISIAVFSFRRSRLNLKGMSALYVGLVGAAVAIFFMRMIVSQTGNLAWFYLVFGALAGAAASARPQFNGR